MYSPIYFPEPTTVSEDDEGYATPYASGLPIMYDPAYGYMSQGAVMWGGADGYDPVWSLGAGIESGMTHSYQLSGTDGCYIFFDMMASAGNYPDWSKATRLTASGWIEHDGFVRPFASWHYGLNFELSGKFGGQNFYYNLAFTEQSNGATDWNGTIYTGGTAEHTYPTTFNVNPNDNNKPVFFKIEALNTGVVTFTVNDVSWTYGSSKVWPKIMVTEDGDQWGGDEVLELYFGQNTISGPMNFRFSSLRVDTDAPWKIKNPLTPLVGFWGQVKMKPVILWKIFTPIYMPDPISVTMDTIGRIINPFAIGYPNPTIVGNIENAAYLSFGAGTYSTASMVAGIAPGSTNAYRMTSTQNMYGASAALQISDRNRYPDFSSATYIKTGGWFKVTGLNSNSQGRNLTLSIEGNLGDWGYLNYGLRYDTRNSWFLEWYIEDQDESLFYEVPVPAFNGIDGWQNDVTYELKMNLDTVNNTCTLTVNGITTTITDSRLWPSPTNDFWENTMTDAYGLGLWGQASWNVNNTTTRQIMIVDQMRLESDTKWYPTVQGTSLRTESHGKSPTHFNNPVV